MHSVKLDIIKKKILTYDNLECSLALWRFKNYKIVFTNGCFDIIHHGHIEYLSKAADLGNILIIGLNTDDSVKRLKGQNRPVQDENSRAIILASLSFVNAVILFDEDTPYKLINLVQPDVLVKGGDYKPTDIVGYDIVTSKGGKVITIDFKQGYSSTSVIEKLTK